MDRQKVKDLLEAGVLQAYAEGKTIQIDRGYFSLSDKRWEDAVSPTLTFQMPASCYRVKPEPLHDWAMQLSDGSWQVYCCITESAIKQHVQMFKAKGYRQLVPVTEEG